jgi:hypothetical protein
MGKGGYNRRIFRDFSALNRNKGENQQDRQDHDLKHLFM